MSHGTCVEKIAIFQGIQWEVMRYQDGGTISVLRAMEVTS